MTDFHEVSEDYVPRPPRRRLAALVAILALLGGAAGLWLSAGQGQAASVPAPAPMPVVAGEDDAADSELTVPAPAAPKSREEKRFARTDRDDDGRIQQAEYLAVRRRNYEKLDVNGDGRLSFEEYAAKGIAKFAGADADGDGVLVPAEFAVTAPRPRRVASAAAQCPVCQVAENEGE